MSQTAQTVYEAFRATLARHADRPFIHVPAAAARAYADGAIELSYGEVAAAVERLSDSYAAAGYGPGVRVALMLENRPRFFMHLLALNALGLSAVPLNAELSDRELAYLIDHSDAALVVTLPEHEARAARAVALTGRAVALARDSAGMAFPPSLQPPVAAPPGRATEAAMLYTSGTTGKPKGCILTNDYFLGAGDLYIRQGGLCTLTPGAERLITPLPLNHSNAMVWSFMAMLLTGGCVVQLDRFHPSSWWESVRRSRATIIHYLGVMPAMLLGRDPDGDEDFGHQVKFGYGAGVDPRHHAAFEQRFGFPLVEAWAMTETGGGACIAACHEPRHVGTRCFGRPDAGTAVRLVDENGADVANGTPGELLVRRGDGDPRRLFFAGYHKDAAATAEAWQDGWFHTGDVVRRDDAGFLYFVDRRKNIIRRSGENIAAVEVEGVLMRHPAVQSCAVAPVADDLRGEEVAALIQLRAPAVAGEDLAHAIFAFCQQALAYYKTPGYVAFVEALPMTASQKIQRGEVKALLAGLQGQMIDLRSLKKRPRTEEAR